MSAKGIDESKFKYLTRDKLHKQYLTNFLTEIYNVPVSQLKEYIDKFYPNPSALEMIELNELKRFVEANSPTVILDEDGNKTVIEPTYLDEEQNKRLTSKYQRMYGKEVQPVELAGKDGKAIELTAMPKEQVEAELNKKLDAVVDAAILVAKEKNKKKA